PDMLLDLGSGISPIAPPSSSTVYADISPSAMGFLSRQIAGHFVAMDLTRLPFRTGSVPAAVCSEVLEHVEQDREALGEIYRVLEPGGTIYITTADFDRFVKSAPILLRRSTSRLTRTTV
ncbi:MAG: class I SAM-dependent methyltransferase, partial [Gemmatimonadetes bacterium]|nr:class I SAM-dependent methyltransferase [Gemmatimonadota bacterium]